MNRSPEPDALLPTFVSEQRLVSIYFLISSKA
jgi:hypothetical protein